MVDQEAHIGNSGTTVDQQPKSLFYYLVDAIRMMREAGEIDPRNPKRRLMEALACSLAQAVFAQINYNAEMAKYERPRDHRGRFLPKSEPQ